MGSSAKVGIKIAFSEKYADPDIKRMLEARIKQRNKLRSQLEAMLKAKGWNQQRIQQHVKNELDTGSFNLSGFQKAMQLKVGDPLEVNAVTYCRGVPGRFVYPVRWVLLIPGKTAFSKCTRKVVGRGNRLYHKNARQFFNGFGHREQLIDLWAEIDHKEGNYITPFGKAIQITIW